jgi:hypothetical protein
MMDREETKARTKGLAKDDSSERPSLDSCYGRIGIPAVAAAVRPRPCEERPAKQSRFMPDDCD